MNYIQIIFKKKLGMKGLTLIWSENKNKQLLIACDAKINIFIIKGVNI